MSPKKGVTEEHRAPDQDAAIEAAFVEGTLPEEDRREWQPIPDGGSEAVAWRYPAVLVDEPLALRIHLLLDHIGRDYNAWEHVAMRQLRALFVRTMPPNPDSDA